MRTDGHGRSIDQVLQNVIPDGSGGTPEFYRLWTSYRPDGAVTAITRAETVSAESSTLVDGRSLTRTFAYDTVGRRIASTDEDTDSTDTGATAANETWRYLFNEVGDLVAVRDPRGCGQNFYYDHGGRLLGEDYVTCDEAQLQGDDPDPDDDVPSDAIALGEIGGSGHEVDVRYFFDEAPPWSTDFSSPTPSAPITGFLEGRLTAVSDRASRTLYEYDTRGSTVWAGRQIALVPNDTETYGDLTNPGSGPPVVVTSEDITPSTRAYDTTHTYAQVHEYDHGGRPISLELPRDPDWSGSGSAPVIKGSMIYTRRGMPYRTQLHVDSTAYYIVYLTTYSASRQLRNVTYGDNAGGARTNTRLWTTYDERLRPDRQYLVRDEEDPQDDAVLNTIGPYLFNNIYTWDDANNLKIIYNNLPGTEFSAGHVPTTTVIAHDGLYRVVDVDFLYRNKATGSGNAPDIATDWRDSREDHRGADPMRERPAAMLPTLPTNRVAELDYEYDWLANMTSWTDDASSFYERSIGEITNGYDEQKRPSALYLSTNLPDAAPAMYESGVDRGGWLEVDYGVSGNVVAMTVHAQCADASSTDLCWDDRTDDVDTRRDDIRNNCVCEAEAHYQYRWDELNRITEARRYDRAGGAGDWEIAVRQRARYDSGNQRIIKQTIEDEPDMGDPAERVHLYVYPGDYERSGVVLDSINSVYDADGALATETQYLVSGARVVWKNDHASGWGLDPEARMTYAIGDLLGSTSAVFDIYSGELLETRTYYPNGAQETQRARTPAEMSGGAGPFQLEPMGFTGKEADDEVGLTYFGERHLIQHIGRWASPDPLHVHAVGGGEALNSYHYVAGNLLQARDPLGLEDDAGPTVQVANVNTRPAELPEDVNFWAYDHSAPATATINDSNRIVTVPSLVDPEEFVRYVQENDLTVYHYDPDAEVGHIAAQYAAGLAAAFDQRDGLEGLIGAGKAMRGAEVVNVIAAQFAGAATGGSEGVAGWLVGSSTQAGLEAAGADPQWAQGAGILAGSAAGIGLGARIRQPAASSEPPIPARQSGGAATPAPDVAASTPVGRVQRGPMTVQPGTNSPSTIGGRQYSGHALDRMQQRGLVPSVVEDTIVHGVPSPGRMSGTTAHYSPENHVSVITDTASGRVITTYPGRGRGH
jgi:RHS repeat-associated protein